jgi:hypothetical protein
VRIPRTTLKGLLAVALLIAFEASVLELTGGAGVLLIGLALAVGVVRWWQAEDKHFWAGFNAAGVLAVIVFCNYVDAGIHAGHPPGDLLSDPSPAMEISGRQSLSDRADRDP